MCNENIQTKRLKSEGRESANNVNKQVSHPIADNHSQLINSFTILTITFYFQVKKYLKYATDRFGWSLRLRIFETRPGEMDIIFSSVAS